MFTNWKFVNLIRDFIEKDTQFTIRMMIIIVKNNIWMGYWFRNQYEICLVCEKWKPKYRLNNFSNVMKMEHIEHDINTHPHQKWLEIIKKMIAHSMDNWVVLDCFTGSGSVCVASKELKKDFIWIELDPKYVDIANKRLATTTTSLF